MDFFYAIAMELTKEGNGPCELKEADTVKFLVWDQMWEQWGEFNTRTEANALCSLLNRAYRQGVEYG